MDSKVATTMASGNVVLLNGSNISEGEENGVDVPPFTDPNDQPMNLSLKLPSSVPSSSETGQVEGSQLTCTTTLSLLPGSFVKCKDDTDAKIVPTLDGTMLPASPELNSSSQHSELATLTYPHALSHLQVSVKEELEEVSIAEEDNYDGVSLSSSVFSKTIKEERLNTVDVGCGRDGVFTIVKREHENISTDFSEYVTKDETDDIAVEHQAITSNGEFVLLTTETKLCNEAKTGNDLDNQEFSVGELSTHRSFKMECDREQMSVKEEEVLDLSTNGQRWNKERSKIVVDSSEDSLMMEVDEEDASWVHDQDDPQIQLIPPQHLNSPEDSSHSGLLLIDDQGMPYILTPNGEKVFQVEPEKPSRVCKVSRPRPKSRKAQVSCFSLSGQSTAKSLAGSASNEEPTNSTPASSLESSAGSLIDAKTGSQIVAPPASNASSKPIQILANSTSNFLLVPSNLSTDPSKPNTNSALLALSLPVSLNQTAQSTPVLLVLSPVATTTTPSSPASTLHNGADAASTTLLTPKIQTQPILSLPLASTQTVIGSLVPSTSTLPVDNSNSCSPATSTSGSSSSTMPTSSSPSVASSTNLETEPASKTVPQKPSTCKRPCKIEVSADSAPEKIPPLNSYEPAAESDITDQPSSSKENLDIDSVREVFIDPNAPDFAPIFPANHPKNLPSAIPPRRILYCQYCPRAFYYLSDLERHSITHSESKPHVCLLCGKAFKRSSHLERHKHIHTGQRNFICPICSKRFREAGELLRHQRVHTGEKPYQCDLCHMRFAERNTLRRHNKRKHPDLYGPDGERRLRDGQQESAEWYSSTIPDIDSDTDPDEQ